MHQHHLSDGSTLFSDAIQERRYICNMGFLIHPWGELFSSLIHFDILCDTLKELTPKLNFAHCLDFLKGYRMNWIVDLD